MGNERVVFEHTGLTSETGAEILAQLDWFCARLKDEDIKPRKGSVLGDGISALQTIGQVQDDQPRTREPSPRQLIQAMGTHFLIGAIRTLSERSPTALQDVWRLFRGTDVLLTGSSDHTRERDTMFEVLMGSVAAHMSSRVELRGSSNPDVFFTFGAKRIGFECKALYGTAGRDKVRKAIIEKVRQIRDRNPDIDHGWIAVDVTAAFPEHDVGWFRVSGDEAMHRLQTYVLSIKDAVLSDTGLREKLREARPKLLGILFFAQSACLAAERMTFVHTLHKVDTFPAREPTLQATSGKL